MTFNLLDRRRDNRLLLLGSHQIFRLENTGLGQQVSRRFELIFAFVQLLQDFFKSFFDFFDAVVGYVFLNAVRKKFC